MDFLNLDEIATESNMLVTIKGVEYPVVQQTLGQALRAMKATKKAEAAGDSEVDVAAILENLVESAQTLLPSCPLEVLEGLNMKQIMALIEFVSNGTKLDEPTNEGPVVTKGDDSEADQGKK